jgi:hypothetical protein
MRSARHCIYICFPSIHPPILAVGRKQSVQNVASLGRERGQGAFGTPRASVSLGVWYVASRPDHSLFLANSSSIIGTNEQCRICRSSPNSCSWLGPDEHIPSSIQWDEHVASPESAIVKPHSSILTPAFGPSFLLGLWRRRLSDLWYLLTRNSLTGDAVSRLQVGAARLPCLGN